MDQERDGLIATPMSLHDQQRKTSLHKRCGHRPVLILADRFLATTLHQRLALSQVASAVLFSVRPETINKRIRDIRQLPEQAAGHATQPSPHRLASLDDLYNLATAAAITLPSQIKRAC